MKARTVSLWFCGIVGLLSGLLFESLRELGIFYAGLFLVPISGIVGRIFGTDES